MPDIFTPLLPKRMIIAFHESITGPPHDLRDYVMRHGVTELLFIAHPLLYFPENRKKSSRMEYYRAGKLILRRKALHWELPELLLYGKDVLYALWWVFRYLPQSDVYVGVGNINAFVGLILKWLGRARSVIYYVIDYVPKRFTNRVVNVFYHWIERTSALYADATWNLSSRMIDTREKRWGISFPHQLVVPHGVHFDRIRRVPFDKVNIHEILYMGTLLEKQGVQLIIRALPMILKQVSDVTLTIIGKGPYEQPLRDIVRTCSLEQYVQFLGYVANHRVMENRIAKAGIAVALYDKEKDAFSYYTDPGKVRNYLGAGVPVLMTDVPLIACEVKARECGMVIPYTKDAVVSALTSFFSSREHMKKMRENAITFSATFDWEMVFDQAWRSS